VATISQYGATKVAAESLIAQSNSQWKLATLRREIRKIRYNNDIQKASEHTPEGKQFKIYPSIPKTYLKILWDYPIK
jgi:hypothetical protein